MADNKIVIDINLNAEGGGTSGGTPKDNVPVADNQKTSDAKSEASKVATSMARQGAMYIGKQAINWGLQNYGNLTGDYIGQSQIQTGMSIVGYTMTIAKSPVLGSIAVATNLAVQTANYLINVKKNDQESEQIRNRVGTIISTGGRDL